MPRGEWCHPSGSKAPCLNVIPEARFQQHNSWAPLRRQSFAIQCHTLWEPKLEPGSRLSGGLVGVAERFCISYFKKSNKLNELGHWRDALSKWRREVFAMVSPWVSTWQHHQNQHKVWHSFQTLLTCAFIDQTKLRKAKHQWCSPAEWRSSLGISG